MSSGKKNIGNASTAAVIWILQSMEECLRKIIPWVNTEPPSTIARLGGPLLVRGLGLRAVGAQTAVPTRAD